MDDYLLAIRLLWYAPAQGATTRQPGSSTHHPPATPPFDCPAWPCFSSSTNLRKSQPRPRGPAARSSPLPGRHWEFRNIPTDLASVRRTLKGVLEPSIHQLSGTRLRPRDTVNSCHSQPHRTTVHARFLYRKRDRNLEDIAGAADALRTARAYGRSSAQDSPWSASSLAAEPSGLGSGDVHVGGSLAPVQKQPDDSRPHGGPTACRRPARPRGGPRSRSQ